MYASINRADLTTTNTGMYSVSEKVRDTSDVCEINGVERDSFRVSMPAGHFILNRVVEMNIKFLDSRPVLHIVD